MEDEEVTGVPGTRLITDFIEEDTKRIGVDGIRLPKKVSSDFPNVRQLEIYKSKRVSSILFQLFPHLEKLVVKYGVIVGKTPQTLPQLRELHIRSSPWRNILETTPNLEILSLRETPGPIEIKGKSLDKLWVIMTDYPIEVDILSCDEIHLRGYDPIATQIIVSIKEIGLMTFDLSWDTNILFRVEKVRHLFLENYAPTPMRQLDFVETLTVNLDSHDEIKESLPVENLVVVSDYFNVRLRETPHLKRIVFKRPPQISGSKPPQDTFTFSMKNRKKKVTLILDLPMKELDQLKFDLAGIKKIIIWRKMNYTEKFRERTGLLDVITKTYDTDEDVQWYSQYDDKFVPFPGNGNKF